MSNNITLNIVEPGSPTPDPVVPNTGLFTSGIGGPEATAIGAVLILTIAAIVVAFLYRKQKKAGKVTKLVHLVDSTKAVLKSKKRVTVGLTALALLASAGTLTTLLASAGKSNTNAIDGEAMAEAETITPTVSGNELTVELGSEPVFAILPVDITVEQATEAGYTLTAYTDNTDLISTTDSSKVIPMVAVEGDELTSLTDNTYGLSLVQPETKDDEAYTSLSTDQDNPTFITEKEEPTEADDTTTIYYAFYIAPDTPYGTYTGSDITYDVEANRTDLAKVTFDGNGLYFNNNPEQTTNVVRYDTDAATEYTNQYSHTTNLNDVGKVIDPNNRMYPTHTEETFVYSFPGAARVHVDLVKTGSDSCGVSENDDAYFSFWSGNHPEYKASVQADYELGIKDWGNTSGKYVFGLYATSSSLETNVEGDAVTWSYTVGNGGDSRGCSSGYGYYAILTGYDAEGEPVYLEGNKVVVGQYTLPDSEQSYHFLGWSEEKSATTPTYTTEEDLALRLSLTPGEDTTLYAIWQPAFTISYNGNGADSTTNMNNVEQYTTDLTSTEQQVDLLASNFQRAGYGFVGWSTDNEAWDHLTNESTSDDPTIYGPNQTITVDPTTSTKLKLYAVWAPAETNITMQTFDPTSSKLPGSVMALKDERDNEVYAVAKLADGNWWMIENLRLDDSATLTKDNGETKGNTNNPNLPLTNNYAEQITSNKLSASSNTWCTSSDAACYDQSNLNTNNVAKTTTSPSFPQDFTSSSHNIDFDANIYSYGNYYNWYSATAGNRTSSVSSGTVAGDLCPAGWKLPIGNNTSDNGSFYQLNQALNNGSTDATASNRWRSFPNNFVYSGDWFGSSAGNRGYYGYYWSSTADDTGYAYNLSFYSGFVNPGTSNSNKSYGYSVRCVSPTE